MKLKEIGKNLKNEDRSLRNGLILLFTAAALVLFVLNAEKVFSFLKLIFSTASPLFLGLAIAYILNVFVHLFEDFAFKPFKKCEKKLWLRLRRPLAIILAYLVLILVLLFISLVIIPGLIDSVEALALTVQEKMPYYIETVTKWLTEFAEKYDLTIIEDYVKEINWGSILSNVTRVTTDAVSYVANIVTNVASGVVSIVVGLIFSIYMLAGKEKLMRNTRAATLAILPERAARTVGKVGRLTNEVFFSFIRGQLLECVILGVLCYIGMNILRLDYSLLISSIIAITALVPIFGAYIGALAGAMILLIVNPIDSLIFLIFLIVLQQLEGNLIYPRVVGSSIGLPPIWTMFAVLFWGGMMGVAGILIGTPATAVLYRLLRGFVRRSLREKNMDPNDPEFSDLEHKEEAAAVEEDSVETE